jgi:glycyl-radical enzyme activating protein
MHMISDPASVRGEIFGFQAFSVHDGPGIRTTVFFKGCPLRCIWCHNPEGISRRPTVSFTKNRCISCETCMHLCPDVHKLVDGVHVLDRSACRLCRRCVDSCPAGALEVVGRSMSAGEVVADLIRDQRYYLASGGGITISGGEPLIQVDFASAILQLVKPTGIHCAVETCGSVPFSAFEQIAPHADLFLYDLKETDPDRHLAYTGASLAPILDNLRRLCELGADIIIRCPIIPSLNDRTSHFQALAALSLELDRPLELLAYHQLGASKSERMGTPPQTAYEQADEATVASWRDTVKAMGARMIDA